MLQWLALITLVGTGTLAHPGSGLAAVDEAWSVRKQADVAGDASALLRADARLVSLLEEVDLRENEPFAAAVIQESRRLRSSRPGDALRRAELAVILAPSMPQAHFAVAEARFLSNPFSVASWSKPLGSGVALSWTTPRHGRVLLANTFLGLVLAVVVGTAVALLVTVSRHHRRALHDVRHLLPGNPPQALSSALAIGLFLLLIGTFHAPGLLFGAVLFLFSVYLGRQERWVFACLLLFIGLAPMLLGWMEERTAWGETRAALLDGVDVRGDFSRIEELRSWARGVDAPPEALFALARWEKRFGDVEEAKALYGRALRARPDWPPALVNLANLSFLDGDLAQAGVGYRRAVADEPVAEAYFGLSRIHYREVEIGLGQEAREKALALDPSLIDRYALGEEEASQANRYLVDVALSPSEIRAFAGGDGSGVREGAAKLLWGAIPGELAPFAGLGFVLFLLAAPSIQRRLLPSQSCARCGGPACWRCERASAASDSCGACAQVFANRAGLDPKYRVQKELEAERYQRRQRAVARLGSLFLVGPLLQGRAILGIFILVVALFAGFAGFVGFYRQVFGGSAWEWRLAFLAPIFVVTYLASIKTSHRREE